MKRTFETRKLYFGFPVFFLGYKDDVHGYNISTSSSVYSLGSMMVIAMRTKGNAITEITKHQQFTVNVPEKDLTKESEQPQGQVCPDRSQLYNRRDRGCSAGRPMPCIH